MARISLQRRPDAEAGKNRKSVSRDNATALGASSNAETGRGYRLSKSQPGDLRAVSGPDLEGLDDRQHPAPQVIEKIPINHKVIQGIDKDGHLEYTVLWNSVAGISSWTRPSCWETSR